MSEKMISLNEAGLREQPSEMAHGELGSSEFEKKTWAEVTAEGERRREHARERVAEVRSKIVSSAGYRFASAAFKMSKKAFGFSKEKATEMIFSAPELYQYSMEAYRHKGEIASGLAAEGVKKSKAVAEKVGTKTLDVLASYFAPVSSANIQEIGFLQNTAQRFDSAEEKAVAAQSEHEERMTRLEKQAQETAKELASQQNLNKMLQELARLREMNDALYQRVQI
jgi:hypothetical protein